MTSDMKKAAISAEANLGNLVPKSGTIASAGAAMQQRSLRLYQTLFNGVNIDALNAQAARSIDDMSTIETTIKEADFKTAIDSAPTVAVGAPVSASTNMNSDWEKAKSQFSANLSAGMSQVSNATGKVTADINTAMPNGQFPAITPSMQAKMEQDIADARAGKTIAYTPPEKNPYDYGGG